MSQYKQALKTSDINQLFIIALVLAVSEVS